MNTLKGNQIKVADQILRVGYGKGVVYFSGLYGKGLNALAGLTLEEIEDAGKFLESKEVDFIESDNYGIMGKGYKLTDKGIEFVESGKTIREKITDLESESIKSQTQHLAQMENDRRDKELERESQRVAIRTYKNQGWQFWVLAIISILAIIVTYLSSKK